MLADARDPFVQILACWKNNGVLMILPSPPVWKPLSMSVITAARFVVQRAVVLFTGVASV